jgi:tetratricopeptide (TPR) repeat protein
MSASPNPLVQRTRDSRFSFQFRWLRCAFPSVAIGGLLLVLLSPCLPASSAPPSERIPLAVIPAENLSAETNWAHWQYGIPFLLKAQLRRVKALRILPDNSVEFGPDESVEYGLRQVEPQYPWTVELTRKVGEAIEAAQVVQVQYDGDGQKRLLTAEIVDVSTGKASKQLSAVSSNWFEAICEVRNLVIAELKVAPTPEEEKAMNRRFTSSDSALELMSRFVAGKRNGDPVPAMKQELSNAVALDPEFAMAHEALALLCIAEGRADEAKPMVERALKIQPESATARYELGAACSLQGLREAARWELLEAQRLDPDEPLILLHLGENQAEEEGKWKEAISPLLKAEKLAPYSARVHLNLATAYADGGEAAKARAELKLAEHLVGGTGSADSATVLYLARVHTSLHDTAEAVHWFEELIAGAEEVGFLSPVVDEAKAALRDLKPRLAPRFVTASPPRAFSRKDLEGGLRAAQPGAQSGSITNPFAATPAMASWAKQLIAGADGDMEKAQRLFSGLTRSIEPGFGPGYSHRTAEEAFQAWRDPKASLTCQDYTFLYVALAREVGLKAYYALVNRDYQSNLVLHACAGVLIGERALLVDPSYYWFGVPHTEFEFQNDLEAVALYLAASGIPVGQQAALKLLPDRAMPRFMVATALAQGGDLERARSVLAEGLKMDSQSWVSLFARGAVEFDAKNGRAAVKYLRQCLHLQPNFPLIHYALARAYELVEQPREACDEYRAYLNLGSPPAELAEQVRKCITRLHGLIKENDSRTLTQ